jgi:hypothetical protein
MSITYNHTSAISKKGPLVDVKLVLRYEKVAGREMRVYGNFGLINYISAGMLKVSAPTFLLMDPG